MPVRPMSRGRRKEKDRVGRAFAFAGTKRTFSTRRCVLAASATAMRSPTGGDSRRKSASGPWLTLMTAASCGPRTTHGPTLGVKLRAQCIPGASWAGCCRGCCTAGSNRSPWSMSGALIQTHSMQKSPMLRRSAHPVIVFEQWYHQASSSLIRPAVSCMSALAMPHMNFNLRAPPFTLRTLRRTAAR